MEFNNLESSRGSATGCLHLHRKISWSGIFAGIVTALVVEALLNLFGLGVGLVSFTPNKEVAAGIGIGSGIWMILVSIIALFLAGWIASTASCRSRKRIGALQGFITWGLSSLIVLFLMTSTIGAILGGVTSLAGKGLKNAGNAALSQKDSFNVDNIPGLSSLQSKLKSGSSYDKLLSDIKPPVEAYATADNDQEKSDARQALSTAISQNTDLTPEEANQKVTDMEQSYQKVKDKAKQAAKTTSHVLGIAFITTFFSFLLSAIAAILGGIIGSKNRHIEDRDERGSNLQSPHSRNPL